MCVPSGRTLSQTKYGHKQDDRGLRQPLKLVTPVTVKPERLGATQQNSPPGFPHPEAFCLGAPFQYTLFLCHHAPSDSSFLVLDKSSLLGPLLVTASLDQTLACHLFNASYMPKPRVRQGCPGQNSEMMKMFYVCCLTIVIRLRNWVLI